ncbi:class D sortase [Virgibacillus halodenitrificans]|nr:class D sortase [Virgibacillus halodenitrificans]
MKYLSNILILAGIVLISFFGYNYFSMEQAQENSLAEAKEKIAEGQKDLQKIDTQSSSENMAESNKEHNNEQLKKQTETGDNNYTSSKNTVTNTPKQTIQFQAEFNEAFATLDIPKLGKTLPIVEGTDPNSLEKGVGHLSESVFPGDNEQIVLSGHRDTVFRNFGELVIGDQFVVNMPYGSYDYTIKETEIVPEDDTSVIRKMNEEVLVVTTCYPFSYVGFAPERFVAYAYPTK